jgi:hypothetical protein
METPHHTPQKHRERDPTRQKVGYPPPIVEWQPSLQRAKDTWYRALRGEPKGNQLLRLWTDEE